MSFVPFAGVGQEQVEAEAVCDGALDAGRGPPAPPPSRRHGPHPSHSSSYPGVRKLGLPMDHLHKFIPWSYVLPSYLQLLFSPLNLKNSKE